MDLGYLEISHIPFKVFFNRDAFNSDKRLPSEQCNIDIITGIHFGKLLKSITDKKENDINSWLINYENELKKLLRFMQKKKIAKTKRDKYCKNLNYILDFVVQAMENFKDFDYVKWTHKFEETNKAVFPKYTSLNCQRDIHNYKDKNLYIKKIMYDLFDDIEYMLSNKKFLIGKQCFDMLSRINYRWKILIAIYNKVRNPNIFTLDNNFTLYTISKKHQHLKCNKTPKLPKTVNVDEPKSVTALQRTGTHLLESRGSENGKELSGVEKPESLSFQLDINEDIHTQTDSQPKLDTTYAAASLAGISLFGTILYKYGPFRNRFNSRRGAINGSNIFPIDNHVYDANTMTNFEYLQTGIPNGEYQLGYGSVTDY
ncbi:PIR protein [Plasmodium vivax]|nr:PIR protein [Plasmodium vivax]